MYALGRTIPGKIITNAKGGESPHNCMLGNTPAARAFDFAIKKPDGKLTWDGESPAWQRAIEIGEGLGLVSGRSFKFRDYAHFELPHWGQNGAGGKDSV